MENFNAKEYRNNLAKDLKEIRKTNPENAQDILKEAQKTNEYQETKKTHQEEKESKEQLGELAYYPIFRGNTLYNAMFPDVKPLFQAGEEPNAKLILQDIFKHKGERIVMDRTTKDALYKKLAVEDINQIIPNAEIEYARDGSLYIMETLKIAFEKDNIAPIQNLDVMVSSGEDENFFSPEDAKELVSLIKNQIPDANRVILALDRIGAHVLSGSNLHELPKGTDYKGKEEEWNDLINSDLAKKTLEKIDNILNKTTRVKNESKFSFKKINVTKKFFKEKNLFPVAGYEGYAADSYIKGDILEKMISKIPEKERQELDVLLKDAEKSGIRKQKEEALIPAMMIAQEVKNQLGIDLEFIAQDIDLATINEKTAIIYDRHNDLSHAMELEKKIPRQTIIMPITSGLEHAQHIGALKVVDGSFALSKRKLFEKQESK